MNDADFETIKFNLNSALSKKIFSLQSIIDSLPVFAHIETISNHIKSFLIISISGWFFNLIAYSFGIVSIKSIIFVFCTFFIFKLIKFSFLLFSLPPIYDLFDHIVNNIYVSSYDSFILHVFVDSFTHFYDEIESNELLSLSQKEILKNIIIERKQKIFEEYKFLYLKISSSSFFTDSKKHLLNVEKELVNC